MMNFTIQPVAWQIGTLALGALLTMCLLIIGHWFPWVTELPRVKAYVYGVSSILAGFALWRFLNSEWVTVAGLAAICCAGGGVVMWAYQRDEHVRRIRQALKAEAEDAILSK
jgi:hypothetical protein